MGRATGAKRHGPRSTGFWETTIFRSLFTIRLPADVETACIPTGQMKIRERRPLFPFLLHSWKCVSWKKLTTPRQSSDRQSVTLGLVRLREIGFMSALKFI